MKKNYLKSGFSLLEVMVVVVIIGMLAAVVSVGVTGYLQSARETTAKTQIKQFMDALELYNMERAIYPSTAQGLKELTKKSIKTKKAFLKGIPNDPWGGEYKYRKRAGEFEIICLGPDKREGTEDDISSKDIEKGK